MTPLTRANVRLATDEPPSRNAVCVRLPPQLAQRLLSSSEDGASPSVEIELDPGDTTRTPAAFVVDGTPHELSATAVSEIDLLGPDDAPLGATRLLMRVKPTLDGASLRQKQPRPESIFLDAANATSKKARTRKATIAMRPASTSAAMTAVKSTAAKVRKSTTQATISGGTEAATSSTRAVLRASAACNALQLAAIVDGCIHLLALGPLTKESLESSLSRILANSGVHATPTQLRFAMSSALKKVADVPAASGEKYSLLPDLYSRASRSWPHYSQAQRNTLNILQQKRSEAARGAAAREHASESLAPYDLAPGTRIDVQWGTDGWYAATVVRSRVTQHKRRITTVCYDEADQGGNVYEHDLEESPFRLHSSRTMPTLPPPPLTAAAEASHVPVPRSLPSPPPTAVAAANRVPAPLVPSPGTPIPRMTISTLDGYEAAKRRFDSLYSKYLKLGARLAKRTLHYESLARKLSAQDIPVAKRHQDANKIVRQFQAERGTLEATSQEYHELHIELRQIKEAVNEYVALINEAEVGDRT